jgi:hypothetical protein
MNFRSSRPDYQEPLYLLCQGFNAGEVRRFAHNGKNYSIFAKQGTMVEVYDEQADRRWAWPDQAIVHPLEDDE